MFKKIKKHFSLRKYGNAVIIEAKSELQAVLDHGGMKLNHLHPTIFRVLIKKYILDRDANLVVEQFVRDLEFHKYAGNTDNARAKAIIEFYDNLEDEIDGELDEELSNRSGS